MDKIIHIELDNKLTKPYYYQRKLFKPFRKWPKSLPWHRERLQCDAIKTELCKRCVDDDIIFISDLDEIIRRDDLLKIVSAISEKPKSIAYCTMPMYKFYLNVTETEFYPSDNLWMGSYAAQWKKLKKHSLDALRRARWSKKRKKQLRAIEFKNSGWHFTALGGFEAMVRKHETTAHAESNKPSLKTKEHYLSVLSNGEEVVIDETFPRYVLTHLSELKEKGLIKSAS